MNYATLTFACFFLLTGIFYFSVPKKFQWSVLLMASLAFYVLSCGSRVILLIAAATIAYLAALIIDHLDHAFDIRKEALSKEEKKLLKKRTMHRKKTIVAVSVTLTLLMLLGTKYCNFFGALFNRAFHIWGQAHPLPVWSIFMPLGISYYTLMSISYITDVYRRRAKAEKNPLMILLFLCYFPHIVEGPLDRYSTLSQQFRRSHCMDYNRIKDGAVRFLWGIFKKIVIADRAGFIVNSLFGEVASCSGSTLLVATILYTLQIYAEFSGCMDMVCGASQILDINIAENFKRPFFSSSINEFWRRWHITLGLWLKDYVFYPISLSGHFKKLNAAAKGRIKSHRFIALLPRAYALFFVWFLNGLWHGASLKYICYGLYYYVLMMFGQMARPLFDRMVTALSISKSAAGYRIFGVIRTCTIVCFGMLIFRAESLSQAWEIFVKTLTDSHMAEISDSILLSGSIHTWDYLILAISSILLFFVSLTEEKGIDVRRWLSNQILPLRWAIYLMLLFSIIIFGAYGGDFTNTTFIYGEF